MKRIFYLIASIIFFSVSFADGLKGQNVFENIVSFDKVVYNFGDILIENGRQTCVFKMKNISNAPVIIQNVLNSCGCTKSSWTKTPIKPNESGEIKVTYLNNQGERPFIKGITVYVSGLSKPVFLKIKGVAHKKVLSLKELFPITYGPIGFKEKKIAMGYIEQGLSRSIDVEIANLSNKETKVSFAKITQGMSISMKNKKIAANSKQKFTCTINTAETSEKKWGKTPFSFTLINNGKKYPQALVIEPLIKENFTSLTSSQKNAASLPQFNKTSMEFGTVPAGKILEKDYIFRNIGKEPFIIYRADSEESGVKITWGDAVNCGEEGKVHVRIDTKGKAEGEMLNVLTLITNSPIRPVINLFAVYNIEKKAE